MEKTLRQRLEEKGWDEEYIEKTINILEKEKTKPEVSVLERINSVVYWVALLICILGNFVISIVLIPFLVTFTNKIALSIIIGSISLSFGFLFKVLLKDIEELDQNHHIIAGLFIPALSLINVIIIVNVANHLIALLNIQSPHNPYIIGVIYVLSFSLPYIIDKVITKHSNKKSVPITI